MITEKYVFVISALTEYEEIDLVEMSDEEFVAVCKEDGRIYSLEDFPAAFNSGEISSNIDYLRILED